MRSHALVRQLVKRAVDFDSMCRGAYAAEYLAVSHRCASPPALLARPSSPPALLLPPLPALPPSSSLLPPHHTLHASQLGDAQPQRGDAGRIEAAMAGARRATLPTAMSFSNSRGDVRSRTAALHSALGVRLYALAEFVLEQGLSKAAWPAWNALLMGVLTHPSPDTLQHLGFSADSPHLVAATKNGFYVWD